MKLPLPSYDLWEEKRGCSTYTAAAVHGALMAAAELAKILGKQDHDRRYRQVATDIREGILEHLWDEKRGVFHKLMHRIGRDITTDSTIDISSVYGVFAFGVLAPDDPKLALAFENTVRALSYGITAGGIARYEGDEYYRTERESAGNPWITTTLWYAEYLIATAKKEGDLARVRDIFTWVAKHASLSGVLPEQVHPKTGEQLSATPLMWSHASYVSAVIKYLDKLEELGVCKACNPAP